MDTNSSAKSECEFCRELTSPCESRFSLIYSDVLKSRIIWEDGEFVVIPTLGQILKGSLLIVPRIHAERFADLPRESRSHAQAIFAGIIKSGRGPMIAFEHGARCLTGGGCGIFHAHLHIVPVPKSFRIDQILPAGRAEHAGLLEAWQKNELTDEYLIVGDTSGDFASVDRAMIKGFGISSQHMRKLIAKHFEIERPWDWREYDQPEPDLIQLVNEWRLADVS